MNTPTWFLSWLVAVPKKGSVGAMKEEQPTWPICMPEMRTKAHLQKYPHVMLFLLPNTFQVLLSILMHLKTNFFSFQTVVIFSYLGMLNSANL
jgi:hypothetical protein